MLKVYLIFFFLLLGGICSVSEAKSYTDRDTDAWHQFETTENPPVDIIAASHTRCGAKIKKSEKRQPDTVTADTDMGLRLGHLRYSCAVGEWMPMPMLGYYRHIHRQALF